jgi:hypothetical protein
MEFDLPLYAVQRLADGTWLVRTQMGDPLWPPVDVVAGRRLQEKLGMLGAAARRGLRRAMYWTAVWH